MTPSGEVMAAASGKGAPTPAPEHSQTAALIDAYARDPRPLALRCGVQHYDWGDRDYIPTLLGQPAPADRPHAELWIGAHHDLPAAADLGGVPVPLDQLIASAPRVLLGAETTARHGAELPFLFKVLAAAMPLSIQAHPNRAQAAQGFADEEQRGIPRHDTRRNYRDRNHKPELLVALTPFAALRGFRPLPEIGAELAQYPGLGTLAAGLDGAAGLRRLYANLMRLPQPDIDALLGPVIARCRQRAHDPSDSGQDRCRWLLRADRLFSRDRHHDRGLMAFLLLNLLHLRPGQAIFLPAGELHSYLSGVGLELMANSNNVLRGGLTDKHIDVGALLDILQVHPHAPEICEPAAVPGTPGLAAYTPPTGEFALRRLRLAGGAAHRLAPPAIVLGLVLNGSLDVTGGGGRLNLRRGGTFLLPAAVNALLGTTGGADVALATVATAGRG
jgi:mannose-6-phosphate isomerase class I